MNKIILEHNKVNGMFIEAITIDWVELNKIEDRLPVKDNLIYKGNHMAKDSTDVYAVFTINDVGDVYAVRID